MRPEKKLRYDECPGKMKEKLDWNFIVFIFVALIATCFYYRFKDEIWDIVVTNMIVLIGIFVMFLIEIARKNMAIKKFQE